MKCYTIGHSNHPISKFICLLKDNNIDLLFDVRSTPFSSHFPQYNRENLSSTLLENNIKYIFIGESLGARHHESNFLYPDGKVNFSKVRETKEYRLGVQKIINHIRKGFTAAIMCSEKDPYDCHRFVLLSYSLEKIGLDVEHILENGSIISNLTLEKRLKKEYSQRDLMSFKGIPEEEQLDLLYEKRNREIAYNAFK